MAPMESSACAPERVHSSGWQILPPSRAPCNLCNAPQVGPAPLTGSRSAHSAAALEQLRIEVLERQLTGDIEMACGATLTPAALSDSSEGDTLTPVADASRAPRFVLKRHMLFAKSVAPAWSCACTALSSMHLCFACALLPSLPHQSL